jgi:hypothetical protein
MKHDCCTYYCEQGRDCPIRVNPTHRRYPRTLAEAFPRYPAPDFAEEGQDYHKALEVALIALLVALPVIVWLR